MPVQIADDCYCPACGTSFKTAQGTKSHLSQSRRCAWYRKGKNPEGIRRTMRTPTPPPLDEFPGDVIITPDLPVFEAVEQWEEELFRFIPADSDPNQPGPSSRSARASSAADTANPGDILSDEEEQVVEVHPTAGKVIRMSDDLYAKWAHSFGLEPDRDGDIAMGGSDSPNGFAPFASELDWRIAQWVVKDGPGHKAFDRLLDIPGVCFPPFHL